MTALHLPSTPLLRQRQRRSARNNERGRMHPSPPVSPKIWLAVAGATLGAFMAVLNIQIVNASLADIQGAIGAGIDDGGWISTSYLIAEIVVIPLSGWLTQVFSSPRFTC